MDLYEKRETLLYKELYYTEQEEETKRKTNEWEDRIEKKWKESLLGLIYYVRSER